MSNTAPNISPAGWPSNMDAQERARHFQDAIVQWVDDKRLQEVMERAELGKLEGMERVLALRNSTLAGMIRHCRLRPRADARLAIFALIAALSDNAQGQCRLTIRRMSEIFLRTQRSIRECIDSLEEERLLGVQRVDGLPNTYWPLVPVGLTDMSAHVTWFADALSRRSAARTEMVDSGTVVPPHPGTTVPPPLNSCSSPPRNSCDTTPEQEAHSISLISSTLSPGEVDDASSRPTPPTMTSSGYLVSNHHDPIPIRTIESWRNEFPHIANLDAQIGKLATVILQRGIMHAGWAQPAAWMRGCLAEDDAKAKREADYAKAKVANLSNRSGPGQRNNPDWLRKTVGAEKYEQIMANQKGQEGNVDA